MVHTDNNFSSSLLMMAFGQEHEKAWHLAIISHLLFTTLVSADTRAHLRWHLECLMAHGVGWIYRFRSMSHRTKTDSSTETLYI